MLDAERSSILRTLEGRGALDDFLELQRNLAECEAAAATLRERFRAAEIMEGESTQLDIDRINLKRRLQEDHQGRKTALDEASLSGFDEDNAIDEDPAVRQALDQLLQRKGKLAVEDVAFTIFPQRIWQMSHGDRTRLFDLYKGTFKRWQAMNRRNNGRGLYFERMVMYGRGPCDGNQLEWALSQYGKRQLKAVLLSAR